MTIISLNKLLFDIIHKIVYWKLSVRFSFLCIFLYLRNWKLFGISSSGILHYILWIVFTCDLEGRREAKTIITKTIVVSRGWTLINRKCVLSDSWKLPTQNSRQLRFLVTSFWNCCTFGSRDIFTFLKVSDQFFSSESFLMYKVWVRHKFSSMRIWPG